MKNQIQKALQASYESAQKLEGGSLASYIPELARVNPDLFSICICLVNGESYFLGSADSQFSLQSTSKPFVYSLVLETLGRDAVHKVVGVEPTGEAFNSIIELEKRLNRPYNPMVNSGAIAVSSLIRADSFSERTDKILDHFGKFIGRRPSYDLQIFQSEKSTAHRNRAIAYLMKHFGLMEGDLEQSLDLYFQQCSVMVNTKELATMAATLANYGLNPVSQEKALSRVHVKDVLSLLFTCGMYDSSGEWAFHVGLPAKSGVSGAIFAVVPGVMGIAAYSPLIDSRGHSVKGSAAISRLSQELEMNIFNSKVYSI